MHSLPIWTRIPVSALLALVCWSLIGCGKPEVTVDSAPFESAIATYLERNNMAMAVKEVKEGPTVSDRTATLVASLTHAELGGPSVTWKFSFEKTAEGTWEVVECER